MPPKAAEKAAEKITEKPPERNGDAKAADAAKASATRLRELDAAISSITKTYGEGSITRRGSGFGCRWLAARPGRGDLRP